jgi:hypothetical protein
MSAQQVQHERSRDPYGWRAVTVRVLANALLVLLAFEVVSVVEALATVIAGAILPVPLAELLPLLAVFLLARWIFVLPGLLLVLVGLDYVARRAWHPRVIVALVALAPSVLWEMTKSPGDFPSEQAVILAGTGVLVALVARLPPPVPPRESEDPGGTGPRRSDRGSAVAGGATSPRGHTPDPGTAPDRP